MRYEDELRIPTPEGVTLTVALAGLPSRMIAGLLDLALKAVLLGALFLVLGPVLGVGLAIEVIVPLIGLTLVGYDILFETRAGGRTPGKRACGLRVTRSSGAPVDTAASGIRNLLRLVEGLPLSYLPAIVCVLVTRRNQRLGDLAGDTIVVRERRPAAAATARPAPAPATAGWDVSAVSARDAAVARAFLERRATLDPEAARRLAGDLAGRLRPSVAGDAEADDVRFLERLVAAKGDRA